MRATSQRQVGSRPEKDREPTYLNHLRREPGTLGRDALERRRLDLVGRVRESQICE